MYLVLLLFVCSPVTMVDSPISTKVSLNIADMTVVSCQLDKATGVWRG